MPTLTIYIANPGSPVYDDNGNIKKSGSGHIGMA